MIQHLQNILIQRVWWCSYSRELILNCNKKGCSPRRLALSQYYGADRAASSHSRHFLVHPNDTKGLKVQLLQEAHPKSIQRAWRCSSTQGPHPLPAFVLIQRVSHRRSARGPSFVFTQTSRYKSPSLTRLIGLLMRLGEGAHPPRSTEIQINT